MDMGVELQGRKVVVTGANGVIGRWIVRAFAEAGCQVCATDVQPAEEIASAHASGFGVGGFAWQADLTRDDAMQALIDEVGRRWGSADVLVNNAGVYPSGFLLDIDPAEFDRIFGINLRAPFILTRGLCTQMVRQGVRGSVINVSSGASRKMRRSVVPYCTSKTALDRLTKGFALELAEFGIRVNTLEPGFVPGSVVSELTPTHVQKTAAAIPLGRGADYTDLRGGLLYLASQASVYMTGATLTLDGGNSIGSMDVHQAKKHPL
jgi:3-oxoacyl-[acyl-carrier protein] reductase